MNERRNKKAIVVLSGGMKRDKNGKWVSTDLVEKDEAISSPGGKIRVIAASLLYKENPEYIIYATGGQGYDINIQGVKHPNLSEVIKDELIELSIPSNRIIRENKSNNTFQQLKELDNILKKDKFGGIVIITVKYHLPRVKAMIQYCSELNYLKEALSKNKLTLQSAEEILIKNNSKEWEKLIIKTYKTSKMKKIIEMEKQGTKQIKAGTYKFK